MAQLALARPFIGEVRGLGMLWALELVTAGTRAPLAGEVLGRLGAGLRRRNLHLHRRDNLVYVAPPLVATEADLTEGLGRLSAALDEALP